MKRNLTALFLAALMVLGLCLPVRAAEAYVHDDAGLLTDDQIAALEADCAALSQNYGLELAFLTVESLNGQSAVTFADDYYDANYGEDGALFLLAMAEREWYITTAGDAIFILNDRVLEEIEYEIIPYLSAGLYYEGFCRLALLVPGYIDGSSSGSYVPGDFPDSYADTDYDSSHSDAYVRESGVNLFLSVLAGAVIAGIILVIMRSSMNTRRPQRAAEAYETLGSYHLRVKQDTFLYSNISKRPKPQQTTTSSSGGSHHSSVHRSSGGHSHGGRGGRF